MMKIVNTKGVAKTIAELPNTLKADFLRWDQFDKTPRIASHSREGVIELMPTSDGETYGFKYVNGHPANMAKGFQTVTAFGLLARVDNGYPVLLSEMTVLTALRTAATSVVAAKYLAPKQAKVMGMIGNGAQCEFQALAFKEVLGIETVQLYDIDPLATEKAATNLANSGLKVIPVSPHKSCNGGASYYHLHRGQTVRHHIDDNMIGSGIHINAIGGDCPAKPNCIKIFCCARTFCGIPATNTG